MYKSLTYHFILFLFFFLASNLYYPDQIWAKDNSQKIFEEAEQLYQTGNYRTALEKYKELISLKPSFIEGYRGINRCYNALDDQKGALMFMESLFLEYPERGEVSYGLGFSLYNLGKYDDSLIYFKKAIELNRDIAAAWNNCAVVYHFIIKDFRKARYYYEKALEKSKITGDDFTLKVARENIANLPEPAEIKPFTEKYTLQDFINKFISFTENADQIELAGLIAGQKENSKNMMEWLIGEAMRAYSNGNIDNEKTLIQLADILQEEYSINFGNSDLFDIYVKYKNLTDMEKKETLQGEDMLESGAEMEAEGKYQDALDKYGEALSCFEKIGDKKRKSIALVYLGDVHRKMKNYEPALDSYNKALSYFDQNKEMERTAYTLLSMGEISLMLGKYSEAKNYFGSAIDIYSSLNDIKTIDKIQKNLKLIPAGE